MDSRTYVTFPPRYLFISLSLLYFCTIIFAGIYQFRLVFLAGSSTSKENMKNKYINKDEKDNIPETKGKIK